MESQRPSSKVMRKSCQFCRARKIRCSGERVCGACRIRSIECVYGFESCRGRPRADRSKSDARRKSPSTSGARSRIAKIQRLDGSSAADDSSNGAIPVLGHEIEGLFRLAFLTISSPPSNPTTTSSSASLYGLENGQYSRSVSKDNSVNHPAAAAAAAAAAPVLRPSLSPTSLSHSINDLSSSSASSPPDSSSNFRSRPPVGYGELIAHVSYGLLDLLSNLFGSLGCKSPGGSVAAHLAEEISHDSTSQMFDPSPEVRPLPSSEFGNVHSVRQMIELWFMQHPLSVLMSKTLVLHRLRQGKLDEALLAVILADANFGLDRAKTELAQRLFETANDLLRKTERDKCTLSTIQSLAMLGWHRLCYGSVKRGYMILCIARRRIVELVERNRRKPPSMSECISGVPVAKVEHELIQRIYWFTASVELWSSIQLDMPLCHGVAQASELGFPPLGPLLSPVYCLDKASGNVANLKRQDDLIRSFWPLCHVSSTLARVYMIYTKTMEENGQSYAAKHDGSKPLTFFQLRRIIRSKEHTPVICSSVRKTLLETINKLEMNQTTDVVHKATIAAYRLIALHLLFPYTYHDDPVRAMTPDVFRTALAEVVAFRRLLDESNGQHIGGCDLDPKESADLLHVEIFWMGIDACSKALERIINAGTYGSYEMQEAIAAHWNQLGCLTSSLHKVCKQPKYQLIGGAEETKKRLKKLKRRVRGDDGSDHPVSHSEWNSAAAGGGGGGGGGEGSQHEVAWMNEIPALSMPESLPTTMQPSLDAYHGQAGAYTETYDGWAFDSAEIDALMRHPYIDSL